jgi:hypothetical protein
MPEPCLVFDGRAAVGNGPGLHALIVGVGAYPYLRDGAQPVADHWDMGQLSSTASSAHKVHGWLLQAHQQGRLPVPLATCRLLLSPSPGEPALAGVGSPARLDNFSPAVHAWRDDCKTNRDSVALFYFAGHGLQRSKEDAVLCLEEFRKPGFGLLFHAAALADLRNGMSPAPGFEQIARTQFYFFDACRIRPEKLQELANVDPSPVFEDALEGNDDRSSPIYFGAISNTAAQAVPGDQTLFSRAVIECLEGDGAQEVGETPAGDVEWGVTVKSLGAALENGKLDQLNRDFQADQQYVPGGAFKDALICRLPGPPQVRVRLELIPPEASQVGKLRLIRRGDGAVHEAPPPIAPHPYEHTVPAGMYDLELTFEPPHPIFRGTVRHWHVDPRFKPKRVQVA